MSELQQIFCSRQERCKHPFGAVASGQQITFSLYPLRTMGALSAELRLCADGEEHEQVYPLHWKGYEGDKDCFSAICGGLRPGLYWYHFIIVTARGLRYVSKGRGGCGVISEQLADRFQQTVYDSACEVASWFGEGITYNIFPDRFCRTKLPTEDGYRTVRYVHKNWEDTPFFEPDAKGEILNNDFFGGSLQGVLRKLDYLQSLHVRTLYLNPIFEAFSNHRYDTGDYKTIDPMIGTEQGFAQLCKEAEARGMRVVLDGVFSHTGYDSRYFNARGHYDSVGAYQSEDSAYFNWYEFTKWPEEYSAWWGIYTLPQVQEMNPDYLNYIIDDANSVIRHWLRAGASGWRLDVADELPDEFIEKLRKAARETKPDALIVGEVWEDASNKVSYGVRRRYFQGGELDSVMNYPLRDGILAYLSGAPAEEFAETIHALQENYPRAVFYNLMNIIGTHDTPRVLTALGAHPDDWNESRAARATKRLSGDALDSAKKLLKMAATIQFTMPGSPTIYYGDEAGQQGYEDPFNRRTYPWGAEDQELLAFYRRLCAVRTERAALVQGELRFVLAQDSVLIYERVLEKEHIMVAVNRADTAVSVEIDGIYALEDLMNGAEYKLDGEEQAVLLLELEPKSARIYQAEAERT